MYFNTLHISGAATRLSGPARRGTGFIAVAVGIQGAVLPEPRQEMPNTPPYVSLQYGVSIL